MCLRAISCSIMFTAIPSGRDESGSRGSHAAELWTSRGNFLPGASPGSLPRDDCASFEDLAAPDTPWLGAVERAGQAGVPYGTVRAEALGQLQLVRPLREPQVGVLYTARQGTPDRCGGHDRVRPSRGE